MDILLLLSCLNAIDILILLSGWIKKRIMKIQENNNEFNTHIFPVILSEAVEIVNRNKEKHSVHRFEIVHKFLQKPYLLCHIYTPVTYSVSKNDVEF